MIETGVLVAGGGPAGYAAAIRLGRLGRKVVLVEKDKLGGECLNYGCIPSKALINAAWLAHRVGKNLQPGLSASEVRLDAAKLQAWKAPLLAALSKNIGTLAKASGATVLAGTVRLVSATEARVALEGGEESVRFESALLATGTRPVSIPGFEFDGRFCLCNRSALDLQAPPETLVVVGAGAIGLELGTYYAKLGSAVTVVELMPQILPGAEADLAAAVARSLGKLGVRVWTGSRTRSLGPARPDSNKRAVVVETPEGEKTVEADAVIVSVGRAPSTKDLGLDAAGVKTDARGHIVVDASLRTSAASIFAAGDVAGPPYLAHKATAQALAAVEAMTGGTAPALGPIPMAVFTDPEVASVGESEPAARARGASLLVGRFPFSASGRAQAMRETEGFVKVVADAGTRRLLGVSMAGPHACDLISEACLALRLGATLDDVAHTVHPHPTLPEAFMEACEAALGRAIHILPPGKAPAR